MPAENAVATPDQDQAGRLQTDGSPPRSSGGEAADQQTDQAGQSGGSADQAACPQATGSNTDADTDGRDQRTATRPSESADVPENCELQRILRINVPVIVRLAQRKLAVAEVLNFDVGVVIEFDKTVDEPLDLMVNNKCIGRGQAVKVGENYGLRIMQIGPIAETIRALGS